MIGVEGGWGAGKTTVINLLRAELSDNKLVRLAIFDAWAHEGDPLRRTYLESLIADLCEYEWIAKEKWQRALEELAHRRKTSTSRIAHKTSLLGKWFGSATLVVPIGLILLKRALDAGLTIGLHLPVSWPFVIGAPLSLAEFIVLLVFLVLNKLHKLGDEFEWALFEGKTTTETTQETTETPQPTSIEFERRFRELMDDALPEDSGRFLTVVFDNLDRVNIKDAQAIWATLQTFLQHRGQKHDRWFRRICIVVPYDPSGLRQLWDKRNESEKPGNQLGAPPPLQRRYGDSDNFVSDSFMDKSFQLRFEVPPLVLSDWKSYLMDLISDALPSHPAEDRQLIYRVYHAGRGTDKPPTPRELKLYVNQIGAIHRQWQHTFPLGHVAYYACIRREHGDIPTGLLADTLPAHKVAALFPADADIRGSLAGLYFNVPPEHGTQLLLTVPITAALSKGDPEEMRRLEPLYKDGFWVVLEEVATSQLPDMDAATLARAAECLDKSGILIGNSRSEGATVVFRLGLASCRVFPWPLKDPSVLEGLNAICRLTGDVSVSKSVAAAIRDGLAGQKGVDTDTAPLPLIANLAKFADELTALGHEVAIGEPFTIPGDADRWIALAPHIMRLDERNRRLFNTSASFDQVRDRASERVASGEFEQETLSVLALAPYTFPQRQWEPLSQSIEQRLQAGRTSNSQEVDFLLHALALLRLDGCSEAEEVVGRLADAGHLMHGLWLARNQGNAGCETWCILSFLSKRPDGGPPRALGNSQQGRQILRNVLNSDEVQRGEQMVEVSGTIGRRGVFLATADQMGFVPLMTRCLRIAADGETPEKFFPATVMVTHWKALAAHLPEPAAPERFAKLINRLCSNTELVDNVEHMEFSLGDAGLYSALFAGRQSPSFASWCRRELLALDANAWREELKNCGAGLRLALNLGDSSPPLRLGTPFLDAVVQFAKETAAEPTTSDNSELQHCQHLVLDLLDAPSRAVLPDHLLREAVPTDGSCSASFFQLFGGEIVRGRRKPTYREVLPRLLSPIIQHRNIQGLEWLEKLLSQDPKALADFDPDLVAEFRQRLREELEAAADDDAHRRVQSISRKLEAENQPVSSARRYE